MSTSASSCRRALAAVSAVAVGRWAAGIGALLATADSPMRRDRFGRFGSGPLSVIALASALAGCGGQADPDKFPDPGRVVVSAMNTAGAPVAGVLLELKTADLALVWRSGVTAANGQVEIGQSEGGILPGDYVLSVSPPTGYVTAPGQANDFPVAVEPRQTVVLTVVLARP